MLLCSKLWQSLLPHRTLPSSLKSSPSLNPRDSNLISLWLRPNPQLKRSLHRSNSSQPLMRITPSPITTLVPTTTVEMEMVMREPVTVVRSLPLSELAGLLRSY